jgi:Flp pilus assembly protein CpaB
MRRSPRSVLAWCAALVVAAVTATVVFSDLATLHRRAGALGKPRSVLIATQDLPLGATVGANDVQTISRHASVIPDDALSSMENAVGRTVAVPVLSGSVLLDPHLADPDRDGLEGLVALGFRAVRVRPEDGLQPPIGAVVDVLAAIDPSVTGRTNAEVVAHGARVLAVDATGGESAAGNTAGVTLLVTEDEARELAFASANGVLTLALAPPEDACCSPPES